MAEGTDRARAWDLPAPGRKMNRRQSVVTGCSMSLGWAEADRLGTRVAAQDQPSQEVEIWGKGSQDRADLRK